MDEGIAACPWRDSSEAAAVARAYAGLERQMRRWIDRVGRQVCPGCGRPCCRGHYCRVTASNPWYRFVHHVGGGPPLPADAALRRDPFGLGALGCDLRAGRYVFCYSYNCPLIVRFVAERKIGDPFQQLSELLLPANRLPGGRLLHELRCDAELTWADLRHIAREIGRARDRLVQLEYLLGRALDPRATSQCRQVERS